METTAEAKASSDTKQDNIAVLNDEIQHLSALWHGNGSGHRNADEWLAAIDTQLAKVVALSLAINL